MAFKKIGENLQIQSIESSESVAPMLNNDLIAEFQRTASELKVIAPKANDFLYFTAVMMHAAEAAAINDDGTPKLTRNGDPVKVSWNKDNDTWKWASNDSTIKPVKNSNGDIFPEEELVKAYKKWVGKPLCIDHKSSSVDHVRGFIVDTYYDRNLKRVIALCALDKVNYPDLARKVETGYSTSVSMGTAVGRAVCTDCGRVAKTADDFCKHMQNKSCYGEINLDLSPIELSIVVNGADPKAKIKQIIAAAQNLNSYVEMKAEQFSKVAEDDLSSHDVEKLEKDVGSLKNELNDMEEKLQNIKSLLKKDKNDADNATDTALDKNNVEVQGDQTLEAHSQDTKKDNSDLDQLQAVNANIEAKLGLMKESLDKLISYTIKQEDTMSTNKKAYFNGAGGDNEPTPGKPKYTPDPMFEKTRNSDKYMEQDGDMGKTDGMFPGDKETKEKLSRAEQEERALRRAAAVATAKENLDKKAYFNGAGGDNEPTPGKPKYTVDPMFEKTRFSDKHMEQDGDMGKTDGMFPGDKEIKEKLSRASLKVSFKKVAKEDGSLDRGNSAWVVSRGDKILVVASVNELSGGQSEIMYDSIATRDFGTKFAQKVSEKGADNVKAMLKKAQVPPVEPAPEMEAPAAAPPADLKDEAAVAMDSGKSGDPAETALQLAETVRDTSSDLLEAVRELTGEQATMGELDGKTASNSLRSLNSMRKELNVALVDELKTVVASLGEHGEELDMISRMTVSPEIVPVVEDAFVDAGRTVAAARELLGSFVTYAKGTKEVIKRAQMEAELTQNVEDSMDISNSDDLVAMLADDSTSVEKMCDMSDAEDHVHDSNCADDADVNDAEDMVSEDSNHAVDTVAEVNFTTKEARAALRAKYAAETVDFDDMLDVAHPGGGTQVIQGNPEGRVEGLEEVHDKMMAVVNAPVKLRKEAEILQGLIARGEISEHELDDLVEEGVDAGAVAYYREHLATASDSEFVTDLVKEHNNAKFAKALEVEKVKLSRAYSLMNEMVARGLCLEDKASKDSQVNDIMALDDHGFESLARVVSMNEIRKSASVKMPRVGLLTDDRGNGGNDDLKSQLDAAFARPIRGYKGI